MKKEATQKNAKGIIQNISDKKEASPTKRSKAWAMFSVQATHNKTTRGRLTKLKRK
jgi:hypothetical protein